MERNGRTKRGSKTEAQVMRRADGAPHRQHRKAPQGVSSAAFREALRHRGGILPEGRFQEAAERFWKMRPLPVCTGEVHDVVFLDRIYVAKKLVVLIACSKEHVLAWHFAPSGRAPASSAASSTCPGRSSERPRSIRSWARERSCSSWRRGRRRRRAPMRPRHGRPPCGVVRQGGLLVALQRHCLSLRGASCGPTGSSDEGTDRELESVAAKLSAAWVGQAEI